jgi:hypothetical protein
MSDSGLGICAYKTEVLFQVMKQGSKGYVMSTAHNDNFTFRYEVMLRGEKEKEESC